MCNMFYVYNMKSLYNILYLGKPYSNLNMTINDELYQLHEEILNEYEFFNTYIKNTQIMNKNESLEIKDLNGNLISKKYFDIVFKILYDDEYEILDDFYMEIHKINWNDIINLLIIADYFLLNELVNNIKCNLKDIFEKIAFEFKSCFTDRLKIEYLRTSGISNKINFIQLDFLKDYVDKDNLYALYLMVNLENEQIYTMLKECQEEFIAKCLNLNWTVKNNINIQNKFGSMYVGFLYAGIIKTGYTILFCIDGNKDIKEEFEKQQKIYSRNIRGKYILHDNAEDIFINVLKHFKEDVLKDTFIIDTSVCVMSSILKKYSGVQELEYLGYDEYDE